MSETVPSRRDILKKSPYVVPVILTLAAVPAFAAAGSGKREKEKDKKK